jgi:hypothetical protein
MSRARANPFTTFEFAVIAQLSVLFRGTLHEEKPGVEASRAEGRRYPTAHESEIICIKMELVMFEERWPGHSSGLKIVKQRCALTLS